MSEYVELYVDQGSTFSITVNINDDDTNLAQNVYGYVVTGQLRKSILSQNASANLTCTVSDPNSGEIIISMDANTTSNLKSGTYVFDVSYYNSYSNPGVINRLMEGVMIVSPGVTR